MPYVAKLNNTRYFFCTLAVFDVIVSPEKEFQNVTEWCKKERCWNNVKNASVILLNDFSNELVNKNEEKSIKRSAKKQQKVDNGIAFQTEVIEFGEKRWKEIWKWSKEHGLLTPVEEMLLMKLFEGKIPNDKQCKVLILFKEKMEMEGCLVNIIPLTV